MEKVGGGVVTQGLLRAAMYPLNIGCREIGQSLVRGFRAPEGCISNK